MIPSYHGIHSRYGRPGPNNRRRNRRTNLTLSVMTLTTSATRIASTTTPRRPGTAPTKISSSARNDAIQLPIPEVLVAVHQIISDEITETIAPKRLPFAQGQRVSILGRLIQILEHLPHPFHSRGRRLQTRHRRIFPNLTKETHRPRRDRIHTNLPADINHPSSNV